MKRILSNAAALVTGAVFLAAPAFAAAVAEAAEAAAAAAPAVFTPTAEMVDKGDLEATVDLLAEWLGSIE